MFWWKTFDKITHPLISDQNARPEQSASQKETLIDAPRTYLGGATGLPDRPDKA